jgi:hypothetical protein
METLDSVIADLQAKKEAVKTQKAVVSSLSEVERPEEKVKEPNKHYKWSYGGKDYDIELTTLEELGSLLPLGYTDIRTGVLSRKFEFKKISWDLILNQISNEENAPTNLPFSFATNRVADALLGIGNVDFSVTRQEERQNIIRSLSMGDQLYLWTFMRLKGYGRHVEMTNVKCRSCKKQLPSLDLLLTEIMAYVDLKDTPRKKVTISEPSIKFAGKMYDNLLIEPTKWMVFDAFAVKHESKNLKSFIKQLNTSAIVGIEGVDDFAASLLDLKDVGGADMREILDEINIVSGGPIFAIEGRCSNCNMEVKLDLDWMGPDFLGHLGVSGKRKFS